MATGTAERRLAVVSGAGGGVGTACAERLAATHRLLLTDFDEGRLAATADRLRGDGAEVEALPCDLVEPDSVAALAARAAELGGTEVLINAGGLSPSMADAWRIVEVNLLGTINFLDAFLPVVEPGGVAVCIASIAGWKRGVRRHDELLAAPRAADFRTRLASEAGVEGHPGRGYALSKRGVIVAVERRAAEWGRRGARIVSVSPGLIEDTPMGRLEADKGASGLLEIAALDRHATAADVAAVCLMLASPGAACVTGVDLRVDCGAIPGFAAHPDPAVTAAWDEPAY